jgi:hypothetical protein
MWSAASRSRGKFSGTVGTTMDRFASEGRANDVNNSETTFAQSGNYPKACDNPGM